MNEFCLSEFCLAVLWGVGGLVVLSVLVLALLVWCAPVDADDEVEDWGV